MPVLHCLKLQNGQSVSLAMLALSSKFNVGFVHNVCYRGQSRPNSSDSGWTWIKSEPPSFGTWFLPLVLLSPTGRDTPAIRLPGWHWFRQNESERYQKEENIVYSALLWSCLGIIFHHYCDVPWRSREGGNSPTFAVFLQDCTRRVACP